MYPWRNRAGDVRIALIVVVVHNGRRMAHAAAGKRLAALCHLWHDCTVNVAVAGARVPIDEAAAPSSQVLRGCVRSTPTPVLWGKEVHFK
jgi:hypothetical protein